MTEMDTNNNKENGKSEPEEVIDIDLNDPATEKAATKIQVQSSTQIFTLFFVRKSQPSGCHCYKSR